MPEFILETGFEEMPARFLPGLTREIKKLMESSLQQEMIDFESMESFATPRRLCLNVKGIQERQKCSEELITGPPAAIAFDQDNNLTKAGQGFARSQQISPDQVFRHSTSKGEYLAVKKTLGGRETSEVLPDICIKVIKSLSFPKKMRWADHFTFGRPIRWILALLDRTPITFQISDVDSGARTCGHRVLGPGPFEIASAQEYFDILKNKGGIILSQEERKEIIRTRGSELCAEINGRLVVNNRLLDETANLTEYPGPVLGGFHQKYLQLPREVLLTSMETHQKSFGLEDEQGRLLPYFLTVINNRPDDLDLVRKGWERVLKARLEDARFFWEADKSETMEQRRKKLDRVVFLGPLGSMGDKSLRIEKISRYLCQNLKPDAENIAAQAGLLCKSDLVSEMVGEFADLQGIMGGIYASLEGYPEEAAQAIREHYLPTGHESPVPGTIAGAVVSVADKADTMTGCFGLNNIPTGAADPYALRRQCLGIIRIVLEHGLDFDLDDLFSYAFSLYDRVKWNLEPDQARKELLAFTAARLKAYWQNSGYEGRVIDAVIQAGCSNVLMAGKRLEALTDFAAHPEFESAVLTFKRIDNIIRKQGQSQDGKLSDTYDSALFESHYEKKLALEIDNLLAGWDRQWEDADFKSLFARLHVLRPVVDDFFDNVMVMCQERELRLNRLAMLNILARKLAGLADFSALQV